jgi:hypothetical protein
VSHAQEWRHVMLAMAFDADIAQHHKIIIAARFLKLPGEHVGRILAVARKVLGEGVGDAPRRIAQTLAGGVVTGPGDQGAHRSLRFRPGRALQRSDALKGGSWLPRGDVVHGPSVILGVTRLDCSKGTRRPALSQPCPAGVAALKSPTAHAICQVLGFGFRRRRDTIRI